MIVIRKHPYIAIATVLTAILVVLVSFAKLWSQSFYDFAHLDRATRLYISSARNMEEPVSQVTLEREEFQSLADVLGGATVRFDGRSRFVRWDAADHSYDLYFQHHEDNEPVLDADITLCSDGLVYVHLGARLGHLRYRLENCDIDAVAAVLDDLLGIDSNAPYADLSSSSINSQNQETPESTPMGTTEMFTRGNLVLEISNVCETRTESKVAEGIEPYELTIYTCYPGATLSVVNADMSDPAYAEDHKAHAQWGMYDIETDLRTELTDGMEPMILDETTDAVYNREASIFVLAFEFAE